MAQIFHINDRISVGGALGTVRYSGNIHVWPDILVYGVEWDDPSRGKNDGSVDGKRYFQCNDGRGSFIKASNSRIDQFILLDEAIQHRYSGADNEQALQETISFGSKQVERLGFDKLNSITCDYKHLAVLMLDRQCILNIGAIPYLPKLEHLDLSYNLLTQWSDIDAVLSRTPNILSLNLNGNRFTGGTLKEIPQSLVHISLCDIRTKPCELPLLRTSNLQKVDFGANGWIDEDLEEWEPPSGLLTLDLSNNRLQKVPKFVRSSCITSLLLHNNELSYFGSETNSSVTLHPFASVTSLDIRHNLFPSLSLIEYLPEVFPSLKELRWSQCPAFSALLVEDMTMNLVGRLPCTTRQEKGPGIFKLNGSDLQKEEIVDAEAYIAAKIRSGEVVLASAARTAYLRSKYNINRRQEFERPESDKTITLRFFHSLNHQLLLQRQFMKHSTVLRLKGVVAKHTKRSVLQITVFYYMHDDETTPRRYLDDDIAAILSLGLASNQRLYVTEDIEVEA